MATIVKGGTIITAADEYRADILVEGEKIVQIAKKIEPEKGDVVIDATGLEVYPGCIDVHTHLDMPFMGTTTADDFESGSIAAACGGTTAFVDFAIPDRKKGLLSAVKTWHGKADGKTAVDYGFHMCMTYFDESAVAEIPGLVKEGVTSFKCFLAYKGSLMIDDGQFIGVLNMAKKHGALVSIHAENGEMLDYLIKKLPAEGKTAPRYHETAHPAEAEGEATHRGAVLAGMVGVPLYIVHMSCNEALQEIKVARAEGQVVFAETCPQYLLLSNKYYHKPGFEGAKWVMSPPLRDESNNDIIWDAIRDGFVQTIATDHCSFNMKGQKDMGRQSFAKIPNGAPGIGERVNLIYTYGVNGGRISRNKFAEVMATNPAKLFGMYPQKGSIAVGSDADFTIIDPKKNGKITLENTHYKGDYCSYEGVALHGMCVKTVLRGKLIAEGSKFLGALKYGKFLKRKKFDPADWSA